MPFQNWALVESFRIQYSPGSLVAMEGFKYGHVAIDWLLNL
jgi:hypothetical protein